MYPVYGSRSGEQRKRICLKPVPESEIIKWEETNHIMIPADLRE